MKGDILTKIETSIEINASPEKVWPMIQWDRLPEWYDPVKKVEWTSKEKYKVGSTVHIIDKFKGFKGDWYAEMTESIENEKLSWRATKGFTGSGFRALTPTKDGTKMTDVMEYEMPYSVLGKLIGKLGMYKAFDTSFEVGLKKLKDMMEK